MRVFSEIFGFAECEISANALVKFSAYAESEMKSTHRRSDFTRRRRISHCEAIFHPPVRVDFTEKRTLHSKVLFSGITRRKRYHRKMRTEGSDQTDLIVQNGCRKNLRFTLDNIGYIPYTDYRI